MQCMLGHGIALMNVIAAAEPLLERGLFDISQHHKHGAPAEHSEHSSLELFAQKAG